MIKKWLKRRRGQAFSPVVKLNTCTLELSAPPVKEFTVVTILTKCQYNIDISTMGKIAIMAVMGKI